MKRDLSKSVFLVSSFFVSLILLSVFSIDFVSSELEEERIALIIVSTYEGNINEIQKGEELYDYLIDDGYSEDDIIFLAEVGSEGSDGISNVSNVEYYFSELSSMSSNETDVLIYISDHITPNDGISNFLFADGNISLNSVCDWIDEVYHDELTLITLGKRSGVMVEEAQGPSRTLISSMGPDQTCNPDKFDITRSLEDPNSDSNNDGIVTFVEAYNNEIQMLRGEEQVPIIISN